MSRSIVTIQRQVASPKRELRELGEGSFFRLADPRDEGDEYAVFVRIPNPPEIAHNDSTIFCYRFPRGVVSDKSLWLPVSLEVIQLDVVVSVKDSQK